jgi:predicted 2-oxoglutarate/Fe(II)-dependent dioxygenase YbiX
MQKELLTGVEDLFVIRGFLSAEECARHIAATEAAGYGDAPISTFAGPQINKKMRNNDRVMIDDPALAAELWQRLQPFVDAKRGTSWHASGLNERLRFYRYDPGQQFDWHFDGHFERSPLEQSSLTFMVYLNAGFEGGTTDFDFRLISAQNGPTDLSVAPESGMALVFPHRILHRGSPVTSGRKYVLRSDVMYRWAGT